MTKWVVGERALQTCRQRRLSENKYSCISQSSIIAACGVNPDRLSLYGVDLVDGLHFVSRFLFHMAQIIAVITDLCQRAKKSLDPNIFG